MRVTDLGIRARWRTLRSAKISHPQNGAAALQQTCCDIHHSVFTTTTDSGAFPPPQTRDAEWRRLPGDGARLCGEQTDQRVPPTTARTRGGLSPELRRDTGVQLSWGVLWTKTFQLLISCKVGHSTHCLARWIGTSQDYGVGAPEDSHAGLENHVPPPLGVRTFWLVSSPITGMHLSPQPAGCISAGYTPTPGWVHPTSRLGTPPPQG